jgi:hypothetical protein
MALRRPADDRRRMVATIVIIARAIVVALIVAATMVIAVVVAAIVMTTVIATTVVVAHDLLRDLSGGVRIAGGEGRGADQQRGDKNKGHWAFHLSLLSGSISIRCGSEYRLVELSAC